MMEADVHVVFQALGGLVLALMTWGCGELVKLVRRKSKSELLSNVTQRLTWAAQKAVRSVYQTYVAAIKEGRADGKLTQAEKDEAKKQAIAKAKSYLSLPELMKLFGGKGQAPIDELIGDAVEAGVNEVKKNANPTP